MNKQEIQKAINHLTMLRRLDSGEKKSLYDMAISSLEKQIPKKPICIEDKMWTCPSCDNNLMWKWEEYPNKLMPKEYGNKACLCCGQAIDWGNEDE